MNVYAVARCVLTRALSRVEMAVTRLIRIEGTKSWPLDDSVGIASEDDVLSIPEKRDKLVMFEQVFNICYL